MKFEEKINLIRKNRITTYRIITLDLSQARSNYELQMSGDFIYGYAGTDAAANISIRLNEISNDEMPLNTQRFVSSPFYRFFVTNTAQAGKTLTLAISTFDKDFFECGDFTSGDIATIGLVSEVTLNKRLQRQDYITPDQEKFDSWFSLDGKIVSFPSTIYTVPSGKNLFLFASEAQFYSSGGGTLGSLEIQNASSVKQYALQTISAPAATYISPSAQQYNLRRAIAAGYKIVGTASASDAIIYSLHGWLETA